jgi:hypothetical protein
MAQFRSQKPADGSDTLAMAQIRWQMSRVSELSFLSSKRPCRPSSATQLSSTHSQPDGVCAAVQRADRTVMSAGLTPEQSSLAQATLRTPEEPGKSGVRAAAPCHPRFLTAGHRPELRKVEWHGTAEDTWPAPAEVQKQPLRPQMSCSVADRMEQRPGWPPTRGAAASILIPGAAFGSQTRAS